MGGSARNYWPAVEGIVRELLKPENADLRHAVISLGSSEDESFMYNFTCISPLALGVDPLSDAFSGTLRLLNERNARAKLNQQQTKRFEAIIAPFDDGWSGAYYGMLMRRVQAILRQMAVS